MFARIPIGCKPHAVVSWSQEEPYTANADRYLPTIVLSWTVAEFVGMADAGKAALYLRSLLYQTWGSCKNFQWRFKLIKEVQCTIVNCTPADTSNATAITI